MSSRSRSALCGLIAMLAVTSASGRNPVPILRVCSDPNNLPFSNQHEQGFENRIAELIASDLGAKLEYVWWAQRRGFLRNTLQAGACDVVMGVPAGMERVLSTAPYYRSTYVFVMRRDGSPDVHSFDDPVLRRLRIGVQLIGDDGANTPPAHALARRGITRNITGYTVYGNYATNSPPARIIEAVAKGDVDVAVAWGPMAGYWARRSSVPLKLLPVEPQRESRSLPFVFDIAIGVRRTDSTLRTSLDAVLTRRREEIGQILDAYGVPRLGSGTVGRPAI